MPERGGFLFVSGGARSGKSSAALAAARASGRPVVFVATATADDDEMSDRIARHRAERPDDWSTVEAPRAIERALADADPEATVVIDCLSLWLSNELLAEATAIDETDSDEPATDPTDAGPPVSEHPAFDERVLDARIDALVEVAARRPGPTIVVSNEVGSGIVPMHPLGRRYRDLLGRANRRVSTAADRSVLTVAGRLVELGPPAEALRV